MNNVTDNYARITYSWAKKISMDAGFGHEMTKAIARILQLNFDLAKYLPARIEHLKKVLTSYGYNLKEIEEILIKNNDLLNKPSANLDKALAIANMYGFDKELLTTRTVYLECDETVLHAVSKKLKEMGVTPDLESITTFYVKAKHSNLIEELVKQYPLTMKDKMVYDAQYNKFLKQNNMVGSVSKEESPKLK